MEEERRIKNLGIYEQQILLSSPLFYAKVSWCNLKKFRYERCEFSPNERTEK
jgi:hypothetical protein